MKAADMTPSRPIVITGASGFVGANLCRYFASQGVDLIAVEGPSQTAWRLDDLHPSKKVSLDLAIEEDVRRFVRETQPLAIFNLAAYGAYSNQTEARRIYRVNFDAVRTLLEAAREVPGFRAFVQAGSSSEYGFNCTAPKETDPTVPDSDYSVSKVGASALVQYYGKKLGVPAWAFRLYSVYGPYEDTSRLIPKLLLHAREGKFPPLVNPKVSRDFVYVDDVARAFEAVLAQAERLPKGEIYNIGAGDCVTLEKLVATAKSAFKIAAEPGWGSMPNRHWDHADWYADPSKARAQLGWSAKTSLSDGLKLTMSWIETHEKLLEEAQRQSVMQAGAKS